MSFKNTKNLFPQSRIKKHVLTLNKKAVYPNPCDYWYTCSCKWISPIFNDVQLAYKAAINHEQNPNEYGLRDLQQYPK